MIFLSDLGSVSRQVEKAVFRNAHAVERWICAVRNTRGREARVQYESGVRST